MKMNKIDEINSLKLRLNEAIKIREKCFTAYSQSVVNESRIREKLEDLLEENAVQTKRT